MAITYSKCMVFDLPKGGGGMATGMYKEAVMKKIRSFSDVHNVKFIQLSDSYKLNVWFPEESHYTLFFLIYPISGFWQKPYLIDKTLPERDISAL